jgi:hypothetical protein
MVGEPSVVADGVAVDTRGIPAVSASAVGSLVYRSGSVEQQRRLA